jgi:hypothetical protein
MAFDWREYLELARWLQAHTPSGVSQEAAQRCGIGRAYFSAYGYALNYATQYLGFVPRNASEDHGRLREHLKRKRRRKSAESLDRLRDWRNSADYDGEFEGDLDAMLSNALSEADYVFASLPPPSHP